MMNRSVQHGREQDVMPDREELKKLTEECSKGQVREQEINKIREIRLRQDKRAAERSRRRARDRTSRRWSRRLNADEPFRAPFRFTWRC